MEQTRRQIREIPTAWQALVSRGELEGADASYEMMKALCACLPPGLEEGIKANWAKIDAELAKDLWEPPTLIQAPANHSLGDILC
jgi:hypothetical protein